MRVQVGRQWRSREYCGCADDFLGARAVCTADGGQHQRSASAPNWERACQRYPRVPGALGNDVKLTAVCVRPADKSQGQNGH